MNETELIEQLAEKEHASWSHWMDYLFSCCSPAPNGAATIPANLVQRWQRQATTTYADLPEYEKQSDRAEVEHILPIIRSYQNTPN